MLDRPLTSYHLVLGSVALLLIVWVMMVLSASSVNAYLTLGDSYFYVKRQLIFLAVGLLGAFVIMKLPPSTLRLLSWFGVALARDFVDLDLYTAWHLGERQPQLALPRLLAVLRTAGGVRETGHDRVGS